MRLRNEVGDYEAENAVEGNDRDEKLPGDMEALGGADDETLETNDLRVMLSDAVDTAALQRALEYTSVFEEAGIRSVDDNDEPRVEELSGEDVRRLLRYFIREQPDILLGMADRYPAMTDLLTDLAVQNGAGR
jgi:hypothetical protein